MLIKLFIFFVLLLSVKAFDTNDIIEEFIKQHPELATCIPSSKMIDASGKIPSGIEQGNLVDLGNFDLCLSHKNESELEGKYCLIKISLPFLQQQLKSFGKRYDEPNIQERLVLQGLDPTNKNSGLILGWCIPKSCNIDEFTSALSKVIETFVPKLNLEIKPILGGMCQTKDDTINKYDTNKIILITFLSLTLFLMIISTIYDMYINHYQKEPAHIILLAFSIKTNGEKLLSINKNSDQLQCLNGIRFLSMMWVLYGHKFATTTSLAIINLLDTEAWIKDPLNMYMLNAPVSVDTFFVLSGLLVAYGFCLAKDKGVTFNILIFYIHRYLRLTPVLAVIVWMYAYLLDLFGSGPVFPLVISSFNKFCQNNWWATLLYIQNYYNNEEMCVAQTWYLSIDMQLFILSPILLIPLWKWPKRTMYASGFLVLVSMATSFAITYIEDLKSFPISADQNDKYLTDYYFVTHTRFGTWLIGFMLGYYLFKLKKNTYKDNLHPVEITFGWIVGMGLLLSTLYGGHGLIIKPDKLGNSFFNGLHRHGWALGVSWVIYACTQGYGGPVNTFLSWSVFQVLGKFTYTVYLTHLLVIYLVTGTTRTNSYFSVFNHMYEFWGDFMVSLVISVCLTLAYESPMITIEKLLFKPGQKSKKSELPLHHSSSGHNNKEFTKD